MAPRPYGMLRTPTAPNVAEGIVHDPRNFGAGFDGSQHTDQARLYEIEQGVARAGIADIGSFLKWLDARHLPPQLVQVSHLTTITKVGKAERLINKNLRRQSLMICNFQAVGADIVFSYDAPQVVGVTGGVQLFAGVPVPQGQFFEETNGSVSINDIWVACNVTAASFPIVVLGYEGTLSLAGNKQ